MILFFVFGNSIFAVTINNLNNSDVYLKQKTSVTCTLSSCAMIMRRTAICMGRTDWEDITEESIRDDGWVSGIGLLWSFDSYGFTIGHDDFPDEDKKGFLLSLLETYPQGVEVYNGGNGGQDHAIVITDYDSENDIFWASDPANGVPEGRIKLTETSIIGETQDDIIDNLDAFWFVKEPKIYDINGDLKPNNTYDTTGDINAFNSSKRNVGEYYCLDSDTSYSPLRSAPSGNAPSLEYLKNGRILFVEYMGKNKGGGDWFRTNDGGYCFSGNMTKFTDYSSEIKKFNSTASSCDATYTVSAVFDTSVPLRIDPTEGNNIVGNLKNSSRVHVVKQGTNSIGVSWSLTDSGYYIKSSDLIKFADGKKNITALPKVSILSGQYSAEPVEDLIKVAEKVDRTYKITASSLNVRSSPKTGGIIDTVDKDTLVDVTLVYDGWGYINLNGLKGWISLEYAALVRDNDAPSVKIEKTTLSANQISVGEKITCEIKCTGYDAKTYRYSVIDDSGKTVQGTMVSSSSTIDFTPTNPGRYRFEVTVIDVLGHSDSVTSPEFKAIGTFTINSIKAEKNYIGVGERIVWKIDYTSKDRCDMICEVIRDGDVVKSEYLPLNTTYTFTPDKAGKYTLLITLYSDIYSRSCYRSSPVTCEKYKAKKGDADLDGDVTAKDARLVLRYSAELESLTPEQVYAADVLLTGDISAKDARKILRVSAQLETI